MDTKRAEQVLAMVARKEGISLNMVKREIEIMYMEAVDACIPWAVAAVDWFGYLPPAVELAAWIAGRRDIF